VKDFLAAVDAHRRKDCETLVRLMRAATGAPPRMWGPSIVGFGDYRYTSAGGRENDWFVMGFSPRKSDLTLYLMAGARKFPQHLERLGKHKLSGSCLHIKRLADVDLDVLTGMINDASKMT
jgi:hypothetical protein